MIMHVRDGTFAVNTTERDNSKLSRKLVRRNYQPSIQAAFADAYKSTAGVKGERGKTCVQGSTKTAQMIGFTESRM